MRLVAAVATGTARLGRVELAAAARAALELARRGMRHLMAPVAAAAAEVMAAATARTASFTSGFPLRCLANL